MTLDSGSHINDYDQLCRKITPELHDILLSRYGTVGQVRVIRETRSFQASYSIAIIKPVSKEIAEWLALALQSEVVQAEMRRYTRATAQPDLGLAHIKKLKIPLPPLEEQNRIRKEVERRLCIASYAAGAAATSRRRCPRIRQGILKWALEGKLVDQDPADEPASVLLERIRLETATRSTLGRRAGEKPRAGKGRMRGTEEAAR